MSQTRYRPERDGSRRDQSDRVNALIQAAQAGSGVAFEELYSIYAGIVFRTAYSIAKNQADAEDAMQDTFFRAYMGLKNFRKDAQFRTWITRIAINSSLMILRKQRRRCEISIDGASETESKRPATEFVDARPGPEESYRYNQKRDILDQAIKKLPMVLRSALEERVIRERSIDDAARVLGISPSAVKSRLFRARNYLGGATNSRRSVDIEANVLSRHGAERNLSNRLTSEGTTEGR
ncbi:RNA polymerase sigma factor [Acidicapsa ligni]|uniref:RNA polymerase sigma factor n=1 Tax=Acidicapsa ligni TaxID=542300 RepID=UPI0021DF4A29|nr:sigma-70 family RNA polymerase sigma factor [Acidicapsa ligni]